MSNSRKRKQQEEVAPSSFTDIDAITAAMEHLRIAAPELSPLIESFGAPERLLTKDTSCFVSLAKSIIYQQLAGSAAAAIYARFLTACGVPDESHLTPAAVLAASPASLRACGLSERKASYLTDLAAHFVDGWLSDGLLTSVSDAELQQLLTAVRGIGPWTVDMFSIFHLGHPNILPVGDLGVRKGLAHLCGLKHLPSPEEMQELTAAWQPYRSLGSYYMWRIPLPPAAARQRKNNTSSSKGNGKGTKGKAVSSSKAAQQQQQQLSRAPAHASPLGGAVPAVADVGVNPLLAVQAAASIHSRGGAAVPAAAAAGGGVQVAVAAAGAVPAFVPQTQQQATPSKPLSVTAAVASDVEDRPGVVTRRQLRWRQEAGAGEGAQGGGGAGLKPRVVDL